MAFPHKNKTSSHKSTKEDSKSSGSVVKDYIHSVCLSVRRFIFLIASFTPSNVRKPEKLPQIAQLVIIRYHKSSAKYDGKVIIAD